jgi:BMFP domain-containing protein YqiC
MTLGNLNSNDKAKLKNLIDSGTQVLGDVANLKEGLKETVAAVAEEMDLKPAVLNKAIRVAYKMNQNKNDLVSGREELDEVEQILLEAGIKV